MQKRFLKVLLTMIIFSPLGLLAEGTAWGEWGSEDLLEFTGYVPQGILAAQQWWHAIFPDYTISFLSEGVIAMALGYMLAAVIGAGLVFSLLYYLLKAIVKKEIIKTLTNN